MDDTDVVFTSTRIDIRMPPAKLRWRRARRTVRPRQWEAVALWWRPLYSPDMVAGEVLRVADGWVGGVVDSDLGWQRFARRRDAKTWVEREARRILDGPLLDGPRWA